MRVGEKIKRLVGRSDMNNEELARELGVTTTTVYNMYNRDSVDSKVLGKIAKIFGVPVGYFFEESITEASAKPTAAPARELRREETISAREMRLMERIVELQEQLLESQKQIMELSKRVVRLESGRESIRDTQGKFEAFAKTAYPSMTWVVAEA